MDIERETIVELSAIGVATLLFIAVLVFIGSSYSTDQHLTDTGAMLVVGLLVVFIVGLGAIGYWLATSEF